MSTYEPRDGDEITITERGTVHAVSGGQWNFNRPGRNGGMTITAFRDFDGVDVTVHARALPTKPGSVIRHSIGGSYYFRQANGDWRGQSGVAFSEKAILGEIYDVVFDAGAS